ncbi:cell wall-binding repeat-containing protein [Clostridium sp. cel8]|uniref:cell wall-binding repeat-containing protein n=1 Tax=Clostridium sp. cel8 TaxID=2663123 RepID=UPI0015F355BF|nr:cell wall-binding repeat-containing protein [Clostridium sp. cel8]MBA5851298.1 cell wall-binding repeat-containing protein [Clostridium sp. cel8]
MSKKSTKALASATLMSLVLTTALTSGPVNAAAGSVTRTGGADRYETAANVAKANWTTSDDVILVNGLSYADSVSASTLAKKLNAPILLTEADSLNDSAKSAIEQLQPKNIYIVGGTGAVSQAVEDALSDYNVERLAGVNRYATNLAVANKLVDLGVSKDNMMVVTGQAYSDALSAAPVAAAKDEILLLSTNDTTVMKPTYDFAKDANVTVIGTTNSVDAQTYTNLKADSRVDGGADRFATNLKILKAFSDDLNTDSIYMATAKPNASGADDTAFADALVASAVAGKNGSPLVLLNGESTQTDNAISYIKSIADTSTDLQVIGGTGAVSDAVVDKINDAVNPETNNADPEVSSISAKSLNQIKVVFNQEVDSDTAEDVTNYKVDGTELTDNEGKDSDAVASLQDDNKTVIITLADKQDQNSDVDVEVKKGILTADKSDTVPEFTQTVTFEDTTAPTVDSVSVRGNNKIDIVFSEAVKAQGDNEKAALKDIVSKLKINDKNLSSFGIDYTTEDGTEDGSLSYSALDDAVKASDGKYYYTDEVELYFDDDLPTGDNTLKLTNADNDTLSDAAGFPIADTTEDFTVDTLTSTPEITSITAEDSGKVYINFDRPMDAKTAKKKDNFEINGTFVSEINGSDVSLEEGDTQVKITGVSSLLNKNSNKIYIDDSVKDAYGNNVADDTYESFTLEEDTTKPEVTQVYALDEDTIRVRFSKDVDTDYATDKSNYTLKDSDGTDITDTDIDNFTIPGGSLDDDTVNVVDINLKNDLTDSTYTITIKNIQDVAKTPNVMDDYTTTFDGSDEVSGKVKGVYAISPTKENEHGKIVFLFNKEMDSSTLTDTDNYEYVNGKGDTKTLPSDADITVNGDNKSVTIDLKDTSLYNTDTDSNGNKISSENVITKIYATGVKDEDGNSLSTGNNGGILQKGIDPDVAAKVKENSVRVYYDDDDLKVDLSFDKPIDEDSVDKTQFTILDSNGKELEYGSGDAKATVNPTTVSVDGSDVTLTFAADTSVDSDGKKVTSDDKTDPATLINTIKAEGNNAKLEVSDLKDVLGNSVNDSAEIYSYDAAPRLIADKDDDVVSNWSASYNGTEADVTVAFDTPISQDGLKASDFKFSIDGASVNATKAVASGNSVVFKFTGNDLNDFKDAVYNATKNKDGSVNSSVNISVKPVDGTLSISTVKDNAGNHAYYKPSDDDLKTMYVILDADNVANINNSYLLADFGTIAIADPVNNPTDGTFTVAKDAVKVSDINDLGANVTETVTNEDGSTSTQDKTTGYLADGDTVTLNGVTYTVKIAE